MGQFKKKKHYKYFTIEDNKYMFKLFMENSFISNIFFEKLMV